MKNLLSVMVVAALVAVGCSAGDDQADDVTQPTAVDDNRSGQDSGGTVGPEADRPAESALAFVATAEPDGLTDLSFALTGNAPEPTRIEVAVQAPSQPAGSVSTDGVALVDYVLWTWGGDEVERSFDTADRYSARIGRPNDAPPDARTLPAALADAIAGQPVGARITALFPPDTAGLPRSASAADAHVLVLDIVAFQTPAGS